QRDSLCDPYRVVPGQDDDGGPQGDAARASGEIGKQLQRSRRHRIAGEMMLQSKQGIEPERLGEITEGKMLSDNGGVGPARLRQHIECSADLHGDLPCTRTKSRPYAAGLLDLGQAAPPAAEPVCFASARLELYLAPGQASTTT